MTIPYREWLNFQHWSAYYSTTAGWDDSRPNWLPGRLNYCKVGWQRSDAAPNVYTEYRGIARPINDFAVDLVNLNLCFDFQADVYELLSTRTGPTTTHVHIKNEAQYWPWSPNTWDSVLADAVFYDGVNYWCSPVQVPLIIVNDYAIALGPGITAPGSQWDQPYTTVTTRSYGCRYKAGLGPDVWMHKWQYENNGLMLGLVNPAGVPLAGEEITFNFTLKAYRLYYLNPVVNSLSRTWVPPAGGVELKLYGVCFNVPTAELEDATYNTFNAHPPGGWNQEVYHIQFEGLQGQGNFLLHGHIPNSDFTIDSNFELTIPAAKMPALPLGSYQIYLLKDKAGFGGGFAGCGPAYAYAGDWRAETTGRLYRGTRLILYSGVPGIGKKKPTIFTKWRWKKYGGGVYAYYAPIDTITPNIFYDGRILELSALSRSVSDRGGLFVASDTSISLANHDLEFSKLLAEYFIKNQVVEIFYGWADQPEGWKTAAAYLVVDDYERTGPVFRASLRDITTKYFKVKVPQYRCTLSEYPNIHPNHLNRQMPEVIGNASLTMAGNGGAVEAVCVDTITHKYLAARGSLYSIPQVYADGALYPSAGYAVSYDDGGRTYITFTSDMADKKITFNAQGYSFVDWDSINGYVQNPAYVLLFFLGFIVGVPEEFLDFDAFDILAATFAAAGESTTGYLVLQREQDSENILEEQLFTMGALSAFDRTGRFHVERKGLDVLGTDLFVFTQIDTLDFPSFQYNLKTAINRIRFRWNYCPGQEVYAQGDEAQRDSSIADFEEEIEASQPIDFPWTSSAAWAAKRAEEELLKWGYGSPDIKFSVPIAWIDDLDVLTNFRLQDPFGVSLVGAGEYGRYCYVSGLTMDVSGMKLDLVAKDLNWFLRQYFILGDRTALPLSWTSASFEERIWGYLCNKISERFSDGEIGKKLVDRSLI